MLLSLQEVLKLLLEEQCLHGNGTKLLEVLVLNNRIHGGMVIMVATPLGAMAGIQMTGVANILQELGKMLVRQPPPLLGMLALQAILPGMLALQTPLLGMLGLLATLLGMLALQLLLLGMLALQPLLLGMLGLLATLLGMLALQLLLLGMLALGPTPMLGMLQAKESA